MKCLIKDILSDGYVYGDVLKFSGTETNEKTLSTAEEIELLDKAINKTHNEILKLKNKNPDLEEYLITEDLIATDPNLRKRTVELISIGHSAKFALKNVMEGYMNDLLKSTSYYLRERVQDVKDVMDRILKNFCDDVDLINTGKYILYLTELYPSLLIQHKDNILGVITNKGGYTAHSSIIARSFDIPVVIIDEENLDIKSALIDTRKKYIIVNPDEEELKKYSVADTLRNKFDKKAIPHDDYLFLANISSNFDLQKVCDYGFDGVGLYRTEMIFMNSDRPYTFLEQYQIYNEAVDALGENRFICFRTFDVGDDKKISYLNTKKKGIDNYIRNPEIFETQISAIMKANKYKNVRLMFPMITSNSEFEYLRDWVLRVAKKNGYNIPLIGMMLETKSALMNIESFVKADFISIGTNDLTKELYDINRDMSISEIDKYLSKLLIDIKSVVDFCNKMNICLSVCGELASIKDVAVKFYEIGIKNLSVSPSLIRTLNISYEEFKNNK